MRNQFYGVANDAAAFLQKQHLSDATLWQRFVDLYRSQPDGENKGWRGEYWGKMMRGAALVCKYTQDPALYEILTASVRDMLTVAESDGRVSSYPRDNEFCGWDIWGRKYVMLGCQYYLEICHDEKLKAEILTFLCGCADYLLERIGVGKMALTATSHFWRGINSSSVLEPIVRLYRLTGEKRYLDFASYIVESGGADGVNIFELAYENRLSPYQYGPSKAYELTSCFEGLLEYYEVTGVEKYKKAVVNYAYALIDSEMSIIGSCGITHELLDHTRTRQTAHYDGIKQETCVTVTLMKFFARLLKTTGDSIFADTIEHSFYNAYLGALNAENRESLFVKKRFPDRDIVSTILPFDSYSPLTPAKRGQGVGGLQILPDNSYYGCCACIGAAGVGVFLDNAVSVDQNGITVNFYERGQVETSIGGIPVILDIDTDYPADGRVKITLTAASPITCALRLRNPAWANAPLGYAEYALDGKHLAVDIAFDMPIKLHFPERWEEDIIYTDTSKATATCYTAAPKTVFHQDEDDNYVAVTRGPLTLAADSRTGKDADSVFPIPSGGALCDPKIADGAPCLVKMRFSTEGGEDFYLVDYAHAGRDWETTIAAWLPTEKQ